VSRGVALEVARGWRIAKEKASHKIDVVVALAMAALGAVQQGQQSVGFDHKFLAHAQRVLANAPRGPHGSERAADPADFTEVALKIMPARIWKTNSRASCGREPRINGPPDRKPLGLDYGHFSASICERWAFGSRSGLSLNGPDHCWSSESAYRFPLVGSQ
jgi:hypothetical protein